MLWKSPRAVLAALTLCSPFWLVTTITRAEDPSPARRLIGQTIADFTLIDYRGKKHSLRDQSDLVVLAFTGVECPLAKRYAPRLQQLSAAYREKGVSVLAINANRHDSITEIAAHARRHELSFPILKDLGNKVADRLHAERTPEVLVLDKQRRLRYRGRIDDQYGVGYARDKADRHDLRTALDELLAGKEVSQPFTQAVGCHIGRVSKGKQGGSVTYARQISRLLQKHCVECHRPGEIAPFSLTDYDEVVGWAETIEEVVLDQRMPPWHANPEHGDFANERLMTDKEKRWISQWVADGAPRGDLSELPPPSKTAVSSSSTGFKADVVFKMRERPFRVPAEGTVEYQYFVVDTDFSEDKWMKGAAIIPGNRAVVHHAIVFVRPPNSDDLRGPGWLTSYVPGQRSFQHGPGLARRIPAGSQLVFQMHYTPNGSAQDDLTSLAIKFAKPSEVREEVLTLIALNREFEIPPGASNHRVDSHIDRFPRGARLLAMVPHMHLRGKSFRFVAEQGERKEILLDVPNYDFNWQHAYVLKSPLPLTPNLRINCIAHFDNSATNLTNPNPDIEVRWGDQSWEEMSLGYFEIAVPRGTPFKNPEEQRARRSAAERTADAFLKRHDKDGDGTVDRNEAPSAFATFAFRRYDRDGDNHISRDEAVTMALHSSKRRRAGLTGRKD